jgi:drug/metabolite transporter (DMT)-like permease
VSDTLIAVLLALAAGMSYATAAVLQQRVAAEQPAELSLSPRLIVALVKRPMWLLGTTFDIGAYFLEAAALGIGSIVAVSPLLVSGLLFALPLATIGHHTRVTRREMVPAIMVTAGLATFVIVGSPEGGHSQASLLGWVLAGSLVATISGTCVLLGRRPEVRPSRRALLYGLATGSIYGLTAILTKATVDLFDGGVLASLGHWQPYALAVVSIAGLVLNQSAFQAGHVAASLPAISVVNPVLASTFGILLFDEQLGAHGVWAWAVTVAAIVVMLVGTIRLSRSPLVTHDEAVRPE